MQARSQTAVARTLGKTGGKLDAVVHNAGVAAGGAFEDLPDAELRRVMETNFFGVLALTRALLPTFRAQRTGRIVVVSSESAFAGQPANSIYCASKWAVEGWAESLAFEVSPFGIDVVLVEPGPTSPTSGRAPPASARRAAPIGRGRSTCSARAMRTWPRTGATRIEVARRIAKVLEARRPPVPQSRRAHGSHHHFMRGKIPSRLALGSPSAISASIACGPEQ